MAKEPIKVKCDLNIHGNDKEAEKDLILADPDDKTVDKILRRLFDENEEEKNQPQTSGTSATDNNRYCQSE